MAYGKKPQPHSCIVNSTKLCSLNKTLPIFNYSMSQLTAPGPLDVHNGSCPMIQLWPSLQTNQPPQRQFFDMFDHWLRLLHGQNPESNTPSSFVQSGCCAVLSIHICFVDTSNWFQFQALPDWHGKSLSRKPVLIHLFLHCLHSCLMVFPCLTREPTWKAGLKLLVRDDIAEYSVAPT